MSDKWAWEANADGESDEERWRGLKVEPGRFILNRVVRHITKPDFTVWEIDCRSKYPDAWTLWSADDTWEVHVHVETLDAQVRSLYLANAPTMTAIHVPGNWERLLVSSVRYTVEIVAWNYPKEEG